MIKRVFVLGSGFSKSLIDDMPLINEFFTQNNRKKVMDEIKKRGKPDKFNELFSFIHTNSKLFGNTKYDFDIEKLASFLTSYAFCDSQEKKWEFVKLRNDLKSYINHLIKYCSQSKTKKVDILNFIKQCSEETIFITYNYDILLERLFLSALRNGDVRPSIENPLLEELELNKAQYWEYKEFVEAIYINQKNVYKKADKLNTLHIAFENWKVSDAFNLTTGYGFRSTLFEELDFDDERALVNGKLKNSKVKIYKLHGSINWFKYKGERKADVDNICIGIPITDTFIDRHETYLSFKDNESSIKAMFEAVPEIVPMTYNKSVYLEKPLYEIIWNRAYKALKAADEIYFIGYSFPETDINNTYFYKEFENKIKGVCVYYYKKNGEVDHDELNKFTNRFKKYFPSIKNNLISNKDAILYINDTFK